MRRMKKPIWIISLCVLLLIGAFILRIAERPAYSESVAQVPPFSGTPYVVIHNNQPEFTEEDLTVEAYEYYSALDYLGRCGYTMACIGKELMPTEDRESISQVKPSGWVQAKYDCVDGENLYNRCHLIGFQLTGENANDKNLITGTRYLNVEGMLPFENMVADYIKETGNHVLYRVTPIFHGNNLVASGVQIEAMSVEDGGEGICFHVYAYNHQPGIMINYSDGTSSLETENSVSSDTAVSNDEKTYILNRNSKKFHLNSCSQANNISAKNRQTYTGIRDSLIKEGYVPADCCKP